MDVDLHPPRPGRGVIAGRLADADMDEAAGGALAAHLVAEEFGSRRDLDRKVETERLARGRALGIERERVARLEAVEHARDGVLDRDAQADGGSIGAGHGPWPTQARATWTAVIGPVDRDPRPASVFQNGSIGTGAWRR